MAEIKLTFTEKLLKALRESKEVQEELKKIVLETVAEDTYNKSTDRWED